MEALAWLAETNPVVFGPAVKPLAIGVGRKIWPQAKAAGIKRQALNDALKWRTNSVAYLDSLTADNAVRCDLDGRAIEPVNSEHRAGAVAAAADRRKQAQAQN
jgi:sRNA-binding protein